ncbi:hypothetical protein ACPF8X_00735 [Streptomyces sp. G35A]
MISGFARLPGRWPRWRMFCKGALTIVALTGTRNGRTELVRVYSVIKHLIASGRYDRIDGHGSVLSAASEKPVEVTDSLGLGGLPSTSRPSAREVSGVSTHSLTE